MPKLLTLSAGLGSSRKMFFQLDLWAASRCQLSKSQAQILQGDFRSCFQLNDAAGGNQDSDQMAAPPELFLISLSLPPIFLLFVFTWGGQGKTKQHGNALIDTIKEDFNVRKSKEYVFAVYFGSLSLKKWLNGLF